MNKNRWTDPRCFTGAENKVPAKFDPAKLEPPGKLIPFDGTTRPFHIYSKPRTRADKSCTDVKSEADLFGPGAPVGTIPTDLEQSTGLERLEILGKMQGIDIFDMRPLPADRVGTFTII